MKYLSWVINGAKIREGIEMSYDDEVTHSGVSVTAREGVEQMVVTCCVEELHLCRTKTALVIGDNSYHKNISLFV